MNEALTEEMAQSVQTLRSSGLTIAEIGMITGLPKEVCSQLLCVPEWPKLVTRIEADGTATMVRVP